MKAVLVIALALPLVASAAEEPTPIPGGKVVELPVAMVQRLLDDNISLRQAVIRLERERDEARTSKKDCEESRGA